MAEASHFENRMILEVLRNFQRYRVILEFFPSFFMTKNWFRTKKHSCKFSIKSIVKKLQIGSNIIFLMGMKIIHTCNFLTMKFYEKLQESFFVQNQFVIIKKWKNNKFFFSRWQTAAILKKICLYGRDTREFRALQYERTTRSEVWSKHT